MYESVLTADGRTFDFTEPRLTGIHYGEPSSKVRLLFSEYLEPHPEGFSGYFNPSSTGWVEERVDPCGVHVFKLTTVDEAHLFLVQWHAKGEELHEGTRRQMHQMLDTWTRVFPTQPPMPREQLLSLIAEGTIVSPAEMGLAAENAGVPCRSERTAQEPLARKRHWPFGR